MQQAAINIRHENLQIFPELYTVKSSKEENSNSVFFGFDRNVTQLETLNDWEFFCNELEYE